MTVLACQDPALEQDLRMPAAQGWEAMQRTASVDMIRGHTTGTCPIFGIRRTMSFSPGQSRAGDT
jgi:hypothetical protein